MSEVAEIPVAQILQLLMDKVDAMHSELVELKKSRLAEATDPLMTTAQVKDVLHYETEETVRRLHRSKGTNHLPAVKGMRPLRFRRDIVLRYKIGKRGRELYADD